MRYAAIASLILTAAAHAQLDGTVIDVEQDFSDSLTMDPYTYGNAHTFICNNDPNRTWKATSPAHQPGYGNSVLCDYAKYKLSKNANTDTYLFFNNIDIQPQKGSAQAFSSSGKKIGIASDYDFGFFIQIAVDDILAGPTDQIVVAWNNEGGPPDCYPDLNGDGVLDLFDFLGYVNLFNDGSMKADCDDDNELTLFDFLCFTNAFNAGC